MGVNSLPKTVTRQRRGCDLNPGPSAPESSTLTTRIPSHNLITDDKDISPFKQNLHANTHQLQYPSYQTTGKTTLNR